MEARGIVLAMRRRKSAIRRFIDNDRDVPICKIGETVIEGCAVPTMRNWACI